LATPFQAIPLPSIAASAELLILPLPESTIWITRGFPDSSIGHMRDAHASENIPGSRFDPAFVDALGGLEGVIADASRRSPPRMEGVTQVVYDDIIGGDALVSIAELESLLGRQESLEANGLLQRDPRRSGIRVLARTAADRLGLRPTQRLQLICGPVVPELLAAAAEGNAGNTLPGRPGVSPLIVRTMFPGQLAPRTPEDPTLQGRPPDDPELRASRQFWAEHALLDTSVLRR
jgi:hypothetical protein